MGWGICIALLLCLCGSALSRPLELQQFFDSPSGGLPGDDIIGSIMKMNKGRTRLLQHGDVANRMRRSAIRCAGQNCYWLKSADGLVNVPYTLPSEYTIQDRAALEAAMLEFSTLTCVRFVPHTHERDFLNIISDSGCWSFQGRRGGGGQDLSLQRDGCLSHGIIQHELNHALGFVHEHTRSDRDSYVKIFWNNIQPEYKDSFIKMDTDNQGLDYDYDSVMHYGRYSYSIDSQLPTIQPIPNGLIPIGQKNGLSSLDVAKINRLYNCSMCSSVLSGFSGTFSSASNPSYYPNHHNCSWLIRIPFNQVLLKFSAFAVQSTTGCTADYIRVYDGASRSSPLLLDRACGSKQLPSLVASSNVMLVEFVTDAAVSASGFKASYNTVTCGGTMTMRSGNFSSPGYTTHENYPPFSDCTWTMIAPVGFKVQLNVFNVVVEYSSPCQYDFIEIRDGMMPTSPLLETKCGTGDIPTVTSSQNALLLHFYSDSSNESTGFQAEYSFVPAF
ncbi:hypothetical protein XELAEV_18024531mg [Xenopus laevis]|uniref:Metalloendopeptidase n=1 Tax=Xenopus laevis TaxID=8355 RepID=A0A974HLF5_XENLA|nr:hypothetical protein XELAEV_18024531mg [Xenopus laevis]